jgi:hypothetical protein
MDRLICADPHANFRCGLLHRGKLSLPGAQQFYYPGIPVFTLLSRGADRSFLKVDPGNWILFPVRNARIGGLMMVAQFILPAVPGSCRDWRYSQALKRSSCTFPPAAL